MTLQSEALDKASSAKSILVVCPDGSRDEWETLVRYVNPDQRPYVARAVGGGVNMAAKVVIVSYAMAEYVPAIHRALASKSFDAIIIDRCPATPELMSRAKVTYYIADRIGATVECYRQLKAA